MELKDILTDKLIDDLLNEIEINAYDSFNHKLEVKQTNQTVRSFIVNLREGKSSNEKSNCNITHVIGSLLDKGKVLVEANEYADKCVRRTLFGKSRELAKQRIIVMYLLDEMFKQ